MSSEECGQSTTPASPRSLGPQGTNAQPVQVLHLAQLGPLLAVPSRSILQQNQDASGLSSGDLCWQRLLSCLDFPPEKEALSPHSKALFSQPSPWGSHLPEGALFPVSSRHPCMQSSLLGTASRGSELGLLQRQGLALGVRSSPASSGLPFSLRTNRVLGERLGSCFLPHSPFCVHLTNI